ncbi:MAG TPA: hypothetical protein VGK49_10615 [Ilumatobacteraceae bacterium]
MSAATWMVWRLSALTWHPVSLAFFAVELIGLAAALCVGIGLHDATMSHDGGRDEASVVRDPHRFADVVAELVGGPRPADVHRDVRRVIRSAPHRRPRDRAETAVAAVLTEGPRRLAMVVLVATGLLVGTAPFPPPPRWALAAVVLAYGSFAIAHVVLGQRQLRFGDRQRWSYGSIGEILARSELAGHASRSWTGALGVTVGLSVAVALRGMSDRWTHGLPAMSYEHRLASFVVAIVFVLGALLTVATSPRPVPNPAHVMSRRLEETTARQSLLAAAILVGVVGLVAGILPDDSDHGSTSARRQVESTVDGDG